MKIPVEQILIENQTSDIDEEQLTELTNSIQEQGLSHPIIVRPANGSYVLASGEKRLLAIRRLGWPEIEADVRDITEKKSKEVRIHENLKRFNLPWWDQVKLVEELHLLRQEEYGVAQAGRPAKKAEAKGWSIRDTAEELGVGIGPLSEDLSLARYLRNDPTLKNVKDKKTAVRLVRIAAIRHEAEIESGLQKSFEVDQVFFGDSASILHSFPDGSIDHCITDPPWIKFFDPTLTLDERTLPVFRELYRVLKHGSMLYVFCGLDDYNYYVGTDKPDPDRPNEVLHTKGKLEEIGFQVSTTPLVWRKMKSMSRRGVRPWEYDRDFEFIAVAAKGNPALTSSSRLSGVKQFDIVPSPNLVHPNEKPVELLEDIVTDCSYDGNTIVDPFGGSGALGIACMRHGRHYIICEREKKYYDQICERLRG
jgi:DNA modification methylase/ParB-like chromosome segregation protein Spo0J